MIRLTIRNVASNKGRFAMTTFAVVLGVSFVAASFILSDGLRSTFDDLAEEITAGTDLVVRPTSEFGEPAPLDGALADRVASVEGVEAAYGFLEADANAIQPIKADGTTIPADGPTQLMFSWIDDPNAGSFSVVDGVAPDELGEFSIDVDTAIAHGFVVGRSYDLITAFGVLEGFTLVATTSFGDTNALVGATAMHVSIEQAQALFGAPGKVDLVRIVITPEADVETVASAVARLVGGDSIEVVDEATLTSEQQAQFNESIVILGNVLLGFAMVSLFVSTFIIYNTFSIVLGQRIREMALLRALGAEARQLRLSVLGEAVAVGALASAVGLGASVIVARGLGVLFAMLGSELPDYPINMSARTVLIAVTVGVGVTVVSSILPARAAASISPIAGMGDGTTFGTGSRRRLGIGALLLAVGTASGIYGLFGSSSSTPVVVVALGSAAVCMFVGLTLVSPLVARPVTSVIGWPIGKVMGPAGRLATGNAGRNPRRTATTAAALMIGLTLVTMGYVVGESVKVSLGRLIEREIAADYFIGDINDSGISPVVVDELIASGRFAAVTGERTDEARIGDRVVELSAVDLEAVDLMFDLNVRTGSVTGGDLTDVIVLHDGLADQLGVVVGDAVPVEFASGYIVHLEVVATRADGTMFSTPLVPDHVFDDAGASTIDIFVGAALPSGVTRAETAPYIEQLQATYPQISIDSPADLKSEVNDGIDDALLVVNALLALAVIIALIGIANTLALSVHERTRELGLLRAVGMTRRQTRRMVRWEAVLVALLGATLGIACGLIFGWGVVSALPDDSFGGSFAIPVLQIAQVTIVAALATLLAAWLPARRAGRLDVLDSIAR